MNILIIPDGNRRWAQENEVGFDEAYKRCARKVGESFTWLKRQGIEEVWVLVCTTNNLKRPSEQVDSYLSHFLHVQDYTDIPLTFEVTGSQLLSEKHRVGYEQLPTAKREGALLVHYLVGWSLDNEVVRLVNHFKDIESEVTRDDIIEQSDIKKPIDLIIRTGKVSRISEVVPWHSPYAEVRFLDLLWPDVTDRDLEESIEFYDSQERRAGL
ncbi:MAG TPA: undecaprenyl diphosphate synthase family protein [Candidatus Saccharimonadales bacterium]|nr:undecaprenyl diphosphate synthase family protein [Candidatus Saccharimonadales bacterium]